MSKAIPIKIPMTFITKIEKSALKLIWKHKRPQIAKVILRKKSKTGGITILEFKLYYRGNKNTWNWKKTDMKTKRNKTEYPAMNPCTYVQLIFDKGAKNILPWRKDRLFNKFCCENLISACIKLKL
jgi:hypothetical protein